MVAQAVPGHTPVGLPIRMASRSAYPAGLACVLQRLVIVRIKSDATLYINADPVTHHTLTARIDEMFRTRADRVELVLGASELSYGQVAEVLETARLSVDTVGLLTPMSVPTSVQPLIQWNRKP